MSSENNEIVLEWDIIYKSNEDKLRIFGADFVKNNKNTSRIIYKEKEYELKEYLIIENNDSDKISVKLKDIYKIKNFYNMFFCCYNLLSISDNIKGNKSPDNFSENSLLTSTFNLSNESCSIESTIPRENISYFSTINSILTLITPKLKFNDNISGMFYRCKSLKSLPDISKWDTSNVTNMSGIFYECNSLSSLPDISKWDTSNVTDISCIFYGCNSLLSLPDIRQWKTSKVTDMHSLFFNCKFLISLPDISKWDTSKVNDISGMFYGCNSLISLPKIYLWKFPNCGIRMSHLFMNVIT